MKTWAWNVRKRRCFRYRGLSEIKIRVCELHGLWLMFEVVMVVANLFVCFSVSGVWCGKLDPERKRDKREMRRDWLLFFLAIVQLFIHVSLFKRSRERSGCLNEMILTMLRQEINSWGNFYYAAAMTQNCWIRALTKSDQVSRKRHEILKVKVSPVIVNLFMSLFPRIANLVDP